MFFGFMCNEMDYINFVVFCDFFFIILLVLFPIWNKFVLILSYRALY